MNRTLVLPSPLLPRSAYVDLAGALADRQRARWGGEGAVDIATTPHSPFGPDEVLGAFRVAAATFVPDLVLTHSNAGRYAPLAADRIPVVHVDAALPAASGETHDTGPRGSAGPPRPPRRPRRDAAAVVPLVVGGGARRRASRCGRTRRAPCGGAAGAAGLLPFLARCPDGMDGEAAGLPRPRRHHLLAPDAVAGAVVDLAEALGVAGVRAARRRRGRTTG